MTRLRCWLLQLLLAASVVVLSSTSSTDHIDYRFCGILTYCIVHRSCFDPGFPEYGGDGKGWVELKNIGTYSNEKKPPGFEKGNMQCKRYITISPVKDSNAKKVIVRMMDKDNQIDDDSFGLKLFFEKKTDSNPRFQCKNALEKFGDPDFKIESFTPTRTSCEFYVTLESDVDIRVKLTDLAKGSFEVSGIDKDSDGNSQPFRIDNVDLKALRMPCSGDRLQLLRDLSVDRTEFQSEKLSQKGIFERDETFFHMNDDAAEREKLNETARVACPDDAPMHYLPSGSTSQWRYLEGGLICLRGFLTHVRDTTKTVIKPGDRIKCARKRCGICDAPAQLKKPEQIPGLILTNFAFEEAKQGDRCRTLKCDQSFMAVRLKGSDAAIMHRKNFLNCAENENRAVKKWDLDANTTLEIDAAGCVNEVSCKLLSPLLTEKCEGGNNATCQEPDVRDTKYEEGAGACPAGFDLVHSAPVTRTNITLSTFECDKGAEKWIATDRQNKHIEVIAGATIRCVKRKEAEKVVRPFLGLTALELGLFGGGIFLVVVAVIVVAVVYICIIKKRKAKKKKAMESVSVTFKEPPKYKDGKKSKRDKKDRQVSVVNSLTGSNSGPMSQSGGGSFTPIAPPSKLLTPSKGISKPDKGCAVLDLHTGESKNLKWTNHAGDGPPTKRQTWAQEDSKQEDPQSAIKFAPGELEAARLKNKHKTKKEKSRQASIEYNLGDPKQVKNDDSKIMLHNNFDESSTIKN